jgi:hypothetical protein
MSKKNYLFLSLFLSFLTFPASCVETKIEKTAFFQCLQEFNIDKDIFTCRAEENNSVGCFDINMREAFFETANTVPNNLDIIMNGQYRWEQTEPFKHFNKFVLKRNNQTSPILKASVYVANNYRIGLTGFTSETENNLLRNCNE